MTREEKIICKHFLDDADKTHSCNEYKLLMSLLEQEPTTKNDLAVDAISRAEVLKIFDEWFATCDIADKKDSPKIKIKALPKVTPIRPKGYWKSRWYARHDLHFHVCSECNEEFSCDMETGISIDDYSYCPNCGADMRER